MPETCFGLVATGCKIEKETPDSFIESSSAFNVPSVKGRVWLLACNFSSADAAIFSGNVWT